MSERSIVIQAYLWLALPIILFFGFWFRPLVALPAIGLLAWCVCSVAFGGRDKLHSAGFCDVSKPGKNLCIFVAVAAYVLVSGIGGFVTQIPIDHAWRNAVFFDLVSHPWPVVYHSEGETPVMLCYYFAFWLPAAAFAKLTSSPLAGDIAQVLYAAWGTWITLNMLFSACQGKPLWRIFFVFILFNAWDLVTTLLFTDYGPKIFSDIWHEGWLWLSNTCNYGNSANPLIYNFIYNQGIPLWVVLSLMLHDRSKPDRLLLAFGFLPIYAPFPALALFPFMAWQTAANFRKSLSLENAAGFITALLGSLFLIQNNASRKLISLGGWSEMGNTAIEALLFFTVSIAPFIPFIWKFVKSNIMFWSAAASTLALNCLASDQGLDLAWRSSMPLILLTNAYMCMASSSFSGFGKKLQIAFISVMAVGSVSSIYLPLRALTRETDLVRAGERESKYSFFNGNLDNRKVNFCFDNFISTEASRYKSWLLPRRVNPTEKQATMAD